MTNTNSLIGRHVGNYRLVAELGSGYSGTVYRAEHLLRENQVVAIKAMHTTYLASEEEQNRFLQVARSLAMLKHPHILPILDAGIYDGTVFLVNEYASGGSLRERLDRLQNQQSLLLPIEESLSILSQIGQALHYAHEQNAIHRNLKLTNILFTTPDQALLADFDSAGLKPSEGDSNAALYMAPEQFHGMASKEGDQYALGCIAYELFTGQRPFNAPDPLSLRFKHMNEMPLPPRHLNPDLPAHVEQAVLTAMAKDSAERYQNIKTFIRALHMPLQQPQPQPYEITFKQAPPTILKSIADADTNLTMPAVNNATISAQPQSQSYNAWGYTSDVQPQTPTPVPGMMAAIATATPPLNNSTKTRKKRRWPLLVATIFAMLLLLASGSVAAFYTFAYPGTASISILPASQDLKNAFTIPVVTGNPDVSKNQVAGARIVSVTQLQTATGTSTGHGSTTGATAYGSVVVANHTSTYYIQVISGSTVSGRSGVPIVITSGPVVVPGAIVTVSAHAGVVGSQGNIPAYDINAVDKSFCDAGGCVDVYNPSPFAGGRDAGTYSFVQPNDINAAANPVITPLKQTTQTALQGQLQAGEQFVSSPQCTSHVSSDANSGTQVANFIVTVSATCTGEVYNPQAAEAAASDMLKSQASTSLGANYQLVNSVVTTVSQASITDTRHGTLALNIATEGVWAYHFSSAQEQTLASLINGKSASDAQGLLQRQTGVSSATVHLAGGFLLWNHVPTNLRNITFTMTKVNTPTPPTPTS